MTAQQLLAKLRTQLEAELATASEPLTWFQEAKIRALIGRIESITKTLQ